MKNKVLVYGTVGAAILLFLFIKFGKKKEKPQSQAPINTGGVRPPRTGTPATVVKDTKQPVRAVIVKNDAPTPTTPEIPDIVPINEVVTGIIDTPINTDPILTNIGNTSNCPNQFSKTTADGTRSDYFFNNGDPFMRITNLATGIESVVKMSRDMYYAVCQRQFGGGGGSSPINAPTIMPATRR